MDTQNDTPNPTIIADPGLERWKKYKYFILGFSLLLIISFAVSTFFLLGSRDKSPIIPIPDFNQTGGEELTGIEDSTSQIKETEEDLPSGPSATPRPMKVFTSSKYSYSFSFPADWSVSATTSADTKILEYLILRPTSPTESEYTMTVTLTSRNKDEVLALSNQIPENITINNVQSYRKIEQNSERKPSIHVIIPYGSNTFIFVAREEYKIEQGQILATFKF